MGTPTFLLSRHKLSELSHSGPQLLPPLSMQPTSLDPETGSPDPSRLKGCQRCLFLQAREYWFRWPCPSTVTFLSDLVFWPSSPCCGLIIHDTVQRNLPPSPGTPTVEIPTENQLTERISYRFGLQQNAYQRLPCPLSMYKAPPLTAIKVG